MISMNGIFRVLLPLGLTLLIVAVAPLLAEMIVFQAQAQECPVNPAQDDAVIELVDVEREKGEVDGEYICLPASSSDYSQALTLFSLAVATDEPLSHSQTIAKVPIFTSLI